jgi:hypothetical protein
LLAPAFELRASTALSHTTSLFWFGYFGDGILLFQTSCCYWDNRHVPQCPAIFPIAMEPHELCCPDLPGTTIFFIPAFLIVGITGMHHRAQLWVEMGSHKLPAQASLEPQSSQS